MKNKKRNYGALLGGLIVLIVPLLVVNAIFFTKKPNVYVLPILQEKPLQQKEFLLATKDSLHLEDLYQDAKIILYTDSLTQTNRKSTVKSLYTETLSYPNKTFKDPYPEIYFIEILQSHEMSDLTNQNNWLQIPYSSLSRPTLQSKLDKSFIYLFDNNDKLRGKYNYSDDDLKRLKKDLQNLLTEIYHINSKEKRRDRL